MKEVCRNDPKRTLKMEFYEVTVVNNREIVTLLSNVEFSVFRISNSLGVYMRVFDGSEEIGRVKCSFYNLYYKF